MLVSPPCITSVSLVSVSSPSWTLGWVPCESSPGLRQGGILGNAASQWGSLVKRSLVWRTLDAHVDLDGPRTEKLLGAQET